jgi:hypothetical protein
MAEFYVAYQQDGQHFLAVVVAPQRPAALEFASREALHATMDALGHSWQMRCEITGQVSSDWLEQMAKIGQLKPVPKPSDSIFSFGPIWYTGAG